jgi:hypothetical protein
VDTLEDTPAPRQFGWSRKNTKPKLKRFLTPHDLPSKGINYHSNHLRKMWQRKPPDFPPPTRLSPRKIAWPEEVIDAWLESKLKTKTKTKTKGGRA